MRVYKDTFFYTILAVAFSLLPASQAELPYWMCGPYTLCQVAERHGVVVKPERVAALAGTTKAGTTMKGAGQCRRSIGGCSPSVKKSIIGIFADRQCP